MGYFLQPTIAPAREPDLTPVNNFGETAKNEVPQLFTVESGYRFYSPDLGRWLSRDPIEEWGGDNLASFVANQSSGRIDYLGFKQIDWEKNCLCDPKDIHKVGAEAANEAQRLTQLSLENRLEVVQGVNMGREYGGSICCNRRTKKVRYTGPLGAPYDRQTGEHPAPSIHEQALKCNGEDEIRVGFYHSHIHNSSFSKGDAEIAGVQLRWPLYVRGPGVDTKPRVMFPSSKIEHRRIEIPGGGFVESSPEVGTIEKVYEISDDGELHEVSN